MFVSTDGHRASRPVTSGGRGRGAVGWGVWVLLLCLTGTFASAADDKPKPRPESQRVERSAPVTPIVFDGDVRDLPSPVRWKPGDPIKEIPRRYYPDPDWREPEPPAMTTDPLLELQQSAPMQRGGGFTLLSRNFPGEPYTGASPPDTVGDVGPNHYIQMVNDGGGAVVNIYDKSAPVSTRLVNFQLDSLGSGSCGSGYGDPIVLYDRLADRWMLSEFSSSGNNLCVYVSQSGDPVGGGWNAYAFTAPSFPDYPKYGVWPTDANGGEGSYIVTANDGGPGIYALDRGAMLNGAAATYQRVSISNLPGFGFEAPTPADLDGPDGPPVNSPAIIMRHRDTESHSGPGAPGDLLEMWTFDVDWANSANSVLTVEPNIDVADFDSNLCGLTSFFCFPQPGTGTTLDPLREVIMNRLQYMRHDDHESLVGNFVVDVDGTDHGGIRWFELRRSGGGWTLHQEGTYSIDADSRWMGSSAMDQSGNIAVAYNVSSITTFPSLRYTGRQSDDPLGMMTQPETSIHAGTASSSTNRYGDYAAMNLDPSDDCTFWFTGEDNTASSWRTQIASFKFDACGCLLFPEPPGVTATDNGDNRIDVVWDDSTLDTVTEYLVRRSRTSGGPYETIAVVPDDSPGMSTGSAYLFQDSTVSGGITYYYVVIASDGLACRSNPTNEDSATATGPCTLPPLFAGLESVATPFFPTCMLELAWSAATPECGASVTYSVYRSQTPGFVPDDGSNLLISGLSGTTFVDLDGLTTDVPYYYVVRAFDTSNAVGDNNLVEQEGIPQGSLTTGTWSDDGGDTGAAKMIASGPWSNAASGGNNGPGVYQTGIYGNNTCADLVTPQLRLGNGSALSFYSRYAIESSWDKGEVQISTDGGNSWTRVPVNYPGNSTNTSDNCNLPTGTYFTGTNNSWAEYTADLSTWSNESVHIRFLMSSDTSITGSGWWIDDVSITQVDVPGSCSTGSSCADNPFVDISPEGPTTACARSTTLTASLSGGVSPFSYQWMEDGSPVPGATEETFLPTSLGTHVYNCEVQAASCPDAASDGEPTEITFVDAPDFGGVTSVTNDASGDCALTVSWDPASTVCDGPLNYFVYRSTSPSVQPIPDNLVASGLSGAGFTDTGGLQHDVTYHYLVRAMDQSTAQFDANLAEASAAPTGSGDGVQPLFSEDFESAAAFDAWSVSVQPSSQTCGIWARTSAASSRPIGSTGFYATADTSSCGNPRRDTILTSPTIDASQPGINNVTLSYDLYFNYLNGGDEATVEVWDGSAWQIVWHDADVDVNTSQVFDVTAFAAGNPSFQVRFNFHDADQWFSIDDVTLTADVESVCNTAVGPAPSPSGAGATSPLQGDRLTASGDQIGLTWDTSSCTATDYNLLYGYLTDVASYALSGSDCAMGTSGSYTWTGVPGGDLYFLIVGTDGAGTESSWGTADPFGERNGVTPSGECSVSAKEISGSCP